MGSIVSTRVLTPRLFAGSRVALQVSRWRNRRLEGNILCNLGLLHQVQGRFDEALDQLEAALAAAQDLGDAHLESIVLCNLGMVYDSRARLDEARDHFEAALAIARKLGDPRSEGQFQLPRPAARPSGQI